MLWSSQDRRQVSQQDRIVAVMGPTGAGKSTFIDIATGQDGYTVGHGMKSHTSDIRAVRVRHPVDDYPVVFIDTPGFDDTHKSDTEILTIIANWLVKIHKEKVNLTTILYLHRISDNRMTASLRNNVNMFAGLCGQKAMPNVIIVTTMWGELRREEIGIEREEQLKRHFWKEMVSDGCRIERFGDTHESAWHIIGSLADKSWAQVQLLSEMVDNKLQLNETKAGIALTKESERWMKERKEVARILREQAEKQENQPLPDRIVVVMGPTGAGKSTFIDTATRQDGHTIGHGLGSHTSDIRAVRVPHPTVGYPVVFVDIPGFDDTYRSDTEILSMTADWLVKIHKGDANLATIVYLHRITDGRMAGSMLKHLRMFRSICGQEAMPNVIIATTMWGEIKEANGARREEELKRDFWKDMVADGCRIERFMDSYESAWFIIDRLSEQERAKVQLSHELVERRLRLKQTTAGVTLNDELKKLIKARKEASRKLRAQMKQQDNALVVEELNQQQAEIDKKILQTANELKELKIPLTDQIRTFLQGLRSIGS